jgi:hypothetical protein
MKPTELAALLAPWVALLSAAIVGSLAFRSQIRLKAFELMLERRTDVLTKIEKQMEAYRSVLKELESRPAERPAFEQFSQSEFHHALMLFHQAKGVGFGPTADTMMDTFFSVHSELFLKAHDSESVRSHVERKLNTLAAFYGFAHREMSRELEMVSVSVFTRIQRRISSARQKTVEVDRAELPRHNAPSRD